ncbi:hypothetical protein [Streptomyces sp. NPDC047141]|uniref:hypothetical protein n=1 Tax=Streptomyces sp. NPDC047141 TaxID=3155738 RepID=UPI0033E6EEDC
MSTPRRSPGSNGASSRARGIAKSSRVGGRGRGARRVEPVSAVTAAVRELFGNGPVPADAAWPVAHPVAGALLRSLGLVAVLAPLAPLRSLGLVALFALFAPLALLRSLGLVALSAPLAVRRHARGG